MTISFMLVDVHDNSCYDRTANSESVGFTPVQAIQVGREQWRIQTFADGGANRDLSDNAVLPQHIVLWIA